MSYSNRPHHRPDPTVAPVSRNARGKLELRAPFTPSARQERRFAASAASRKLNRTTGRK